MYLPALNASTDVCVTKTKLALIILTAIGTSHFSGAISAKSLFSELMLGSHRNDVAQLVATWSIPDSDISPLNLEFNLDASRLAVEAQNGFVHILDWRNKRVEKKLDLPRGFGNGTAKNSLVYSWDGHFLALGDEGGAGGVVIRIWDTTAWLIAKDITEPRNGICLGIGFSFSSKSLIRIANAAGGPGNNIIVYETGKWTPVWGAELPGKFPTALAISADGGRAAILGTVLLMGKDDASSLPQTQSVEARSGLTIVNLRSRQIEKTSLIRGSSSLAWSADGTRLAIAGKGVDIVDADSGDLTVREELETAGHMNVRYTADDRYIIESDENARGTGLGVRIWDGKHQTLLQEIRGNIGSLAVSRDGKYFAFGQAGKALVWQFK